MIIKPVVRKLEGGLIFLRKPLLNKSTLQSVFPRFARSRKKKTRHTRKLYSYSPVRKKKTEGKHRQHNRLAVQGFFESMETIKKNIGVLNLPRIITTAFGLGSLFFSFFSIVLPLKQFLFFLRKTHCRRREGHGEGGVSIEYLWKKVACFSRAECCVLHYFPFRSDTESAEDANRNEAAAKDEEGEKASLYRVEQKIRFI